MHRRSDDGTSVAGMKQSATPVNKSADVREGPEFGARFAFLRQLQLPTSLIRLALVVVPSHASLAAISDRVLTSRVALVSDQRCTKFGSEITI
jgi:hypothetical protein